MPKRQKTKKQKEMPASEEPGCPIILESGCLLGEEIDEKQPEDAVKLVCTNKACGVPSLVHGVCYEAWEDLLVKMMATMSWARSWTDAQRRANLWDKKGFLLVAKACKCRCGAGQVRRDLDYPLLKQASDEDPNFAFSTKNKKSKAKKAHLPSLNQGNLNQTSRNKQVQTQTSGGNKNFSATINCNGHSLALFPADFSHLDSDSEDASLESPQGRRPESYSLASADIPVVNRRLKSHSGRASKPTETEPSAPPLSTSPHTSSPPGVPFKGDVEMESTYATTASSVAKTRPYTPIFLFPEPKQSEYVWSSTCSKQKEAVLGHSLDSMTARTIFDRKLGLDCKDSVVSRGTIEVGNVGDHQKPEDWFQNVFPRYGYIESDELDTNVFFVPSHIATQGGDGRGRGFRSLVDTFSRGDRVEFRAIPQPERSGCRWLASEVRLLNVSADVKNSSSPAASQRSIEHQIVHNRASNVSLKETVPQPYLSSAHVINGPRKLSNDSASYLNGTIRNGAEATRPSEQSSDAGLYQLFPKESSSVGERLLLHGFLPLE